MQCTYDGVMLKYPTVQEDSISKLVTDLERLWRTRAFAIGIRKLLEGKAEGGKLTKANGENNKSKRPGTGERSEGGEKKWEVMRRAFRVEAIGFTSVSFTYSGSMPSHGYTGVMARFVVEWGGNHRGCTVHSPEQLWPHTKVSSIFLHPCLSLGNFDAGSCAPREPTLDEYISIFVMKLSCSEGAVSVLLVLYLQMGKYPLLYLGHGICESKEDIIH
jgi:hypothetical protein